MGFLGSLFGGGGAQAAQPAMSEAVMGFPSVAMSRPEQPKKRGGEGWRNILGALGDAMLIHSGRGPMYAPLMQQRREQERQDQANAAIGNYLGQLDPGLRDLIMQAGPQAGMQAYGLAHPKSEAPTAMERNFEFLKRQNPELADKYLRNQGEGAPLIANNGDGTFTIVPRGMIGGQSQGQPAGGDIPKVSDQSSYDAIPPGGQYMSPDGHIRQKPGGPTASPSGGFR